MPRLSGVFKMIEEHTFTVDKCFLCGRKLTSKNKTREHVIPKWLQREFNLWDQSISLLNGTYLPYRSLTIPACFKCNNKYLRSFEDKILAAFKGGFDGFLRLKKRDLFLWLGKIYFGIMYSELFLKIDRTDFSKGTITTPEYIKSFYALFTFLQGIRDKHNFRNFFPASIFIFKVQKPHRIEEQWDFMDNHNKPFISIRMGEIGIIGVLEDVEATQGLEEHLERHRDISLHPLQFRELTAKVLYKALLMNRVPKFMNVQRKGVVETHMMSLQGLSDKPVFDDWDNDEYSRLLSYVTSIPLEICQPEAGKVWTWLSNQEGKSIFIDVNLPNEIK